MWGIKDAFVEGGNPLFARSESIPQGSSDIEMLEYRSKNAVVILKSIMDHKGWKKSFFFHKK